MLPTNYGSPARGGVLGRGARPPFLSTKARSRAPSQALSPRSLPSTSPSTLPSTPEHLSGFGGSAPLQARPLVTLSEPKRGKLFYSADCKRGRRKGATSKTSKIVKKCQKVLRQFSRRAKNVKKFFDTFRQFSCGTFFPAPFGGL